MPSIWDWSKCVKYMLNCPEQFANKPNVENCFFLAKYKPQNLQKTKFKGKKKEKLQMFKCGKACKILLNVYVCVSTLARTNLYNDLAKCVHRTDENASKIEERNAIA